MPPLLHIDIDNNLRAGRIVGDHEHPGFATCGLQSLAFGSDFQFGALTRFESLAAQFHLQSSGEHLQRPYVERCTTDVLNLHRTLLAFFPIKASQVEVIRRHLYLRRIGQLVLGKMGEIRQQDS